MGALGRWIALGAVLLIASPSMAVVVEEEVVGEPVTVAAGEQETTHNSFETSTTRFVFHEERYHNEARVNETRVTLDVYNRSRHLTFESGSSSIDRQDESVGLEAGVEAGGYRADQGASVEATRNDFRFGPGFHGNTTFVTVENQVDAYGQDRRVATGQDASVGQGQLEDPALNDDPTVGVIQFVNGGGAADVRAREGPTSTRLDVGTFEELFVGDWTAVEASAHGVLVACQGAECEVQGTSVDACLVGVRPPFFIDCQPGLP